MAKLPTGRARVQLGGPSPKGERAARVRFAMMLLTQMLHPKTAVDKLADKYQCTETQARGYLIAAKHILASTPPVDLQERREQMRAAFGLAYVECMSKGSHGPAVRALRELALLDGLYPAESFGGRGGAGASDDNNQDIASTDPQIVRKRMADLMDRHREALEEIRTTPAPAAKTGEQPPTDGAPHVKA